jgi:hypothetical protein
MIRGGFDKETRRKAQAFAADALSLWILIINELELYNAKPRLANLSGPYSLSMSRFSDRGACGFVQVASPDK